MIKELLSILILISRSEKRNCYGYEILVSEKIKVPFSFFKRIVINPEKHTEKELKEILLHEATHTKQWHSLDTIFSELFCIAFWFNPFVWLIRNEVRINLEYLADKRVLDSTQDSRHYQFHLLRLTYNKAAAKLINNFNASPLKQRIFMMNKKQTKQFGLMKYLLFIPAVAGLFFFSQCTKQKEETPQEEVQIETNVEEKVIETVQEEVIEQNDEVSMPAKEETTMTPPPPPKLEMTGKQDKSGVYDRTSDMPHFPGGNSALYETLYKEITYPKMAQEKGIQGTVILRFVVTKTGAIEKVEVQRGVHELLDAEAVKAVKLLPKFVPGEQDGEPVDVWFSLPVQFKLK
jgi:TonB family C-terminal domain